MNEPERADIFATTRWTIVRRAGDGDATDARTALAELCQTYWPPLYAYVRRTGASPHDAEDLTQGFFAQLLRLDSLAGLRSERGKFRAFLLASLKHYLSDERDRARAQKRGAGLILDAATAEARYLQAPSADLTPDQAYERQWAITLLETVIFRLKAEYEAAGRGDYYATLRFAMAGEKNDPQYAELAAKLDLSEAAVRVAVHRLRQRYREALHGELRQTVGSEEEAREEHRELRRILSR